MSGGAALLQAAGAVRRLRAGHPLQARGGHRQRQVGSIAIVDTYLLVHIEEEVLRPQRLGAGLGGGAEGVADLQPAAPGRHGLRGGGGGGLPGTRDFIGHRYRIAKVIHI